MDNVHISTHFFFVPNRLIWNNWERFNGEQDNPGDSTDYNPGRTSSTNIGTIRPESQVNLEPCDRLKLERSILAEGTLSKS
jgi:hypothetical protein